MTEEINAVFISISDDLMLLLDKLQFCFIEKYCMQYSEGMW